MGWLIVASGAGLGISFYLGMWTAGVLTVRSEQPDDRDVTW